MLLSEEGGAYREAAEAFRSAVTDKRAVRILSLEDLEDRDRADLDRKDSLLVPVGLAGVRKLAAMQIASASVLALMVPRSGFEEVTWPAALARSRISAVFIDQPAARALALIEEAFPHARRVGVLISAPNREGLEPLRREAERRGLTLQAESIGGPAEVVPALRRLLPATDVFLLVPDTIVINLNNVQQVLLTTYRHRVPVVGFSRGLVKAGAVVAVYSTPAQIGRQGGRMASQWLAGRELPDAQYCNAYSIDSNRHVARSLDLVLPDEEEMERRLGARP